MTGPRTEAPKTTAARGSRSGGPRPTSGFRPDIEGLRALAIGLVLVYHAGITFVPGGYVGVDVFFVISGFLITGMLLKEVRATGRVSLARFYSRRAKRLLPASTVVLVVTLVMTWWWAPPLQRGVYGYDALASAVSLVNWRLADRSVDYQAEGIGASPVQHFWSLAVEEQFYVVWPLLIVAAVGIGLWLRVRTVRVAVAALAVVVVLSFGWSVYATANEPATAFFVTTTRLWELGIGALLAASISLWKRLPAAFAWVLGWAGIVAILASALVFDGTTEWPGYAALLPTLGTAAVIAAGSASTGGASAVLSWRPFVWIGALSYSLYLWHWPLLVAAGWQWGELGQKVGLAVVALSFVPAWLSYRFVENPVRRSARLERNPQLSLSLGLNLVAVTVVAALLVAASVPRATAAPLKADGGTQPGALGALSLEYDGESVSGVDVVEQVTEFVPDLIDAPRDRMQTTGQCHADFDVVDPEVCTVGARDGDLRIFLAGDSKAAQWGDAIEAVADSEGWVFQSATKSACAFVGAIRNDADGRPYTACLEFNENLMERLLQDPPDAVIVSQRHQDAFDEDMMLSREVMTSALADDWGRLEQAGIDVIVLLDNPTPHGLEPDQGGQVPDCLAESPDDPSACAFPAGAGQGRSGAVAQLEAAARVPEVDVIDMSDTLCNAELCPPIIGGVLVYRQGSHVTNTYAMTTQHILADRLRPILAE